MNKLCYNPEVTLSSENSKKVVEADIKRLPQNAVLNYPRGGQFIQWPAFGGNVTKEWLSKNRCPGEQAPLCGTPLVTSPDAKISNPFPATELLIVTRVEGGAFRKEGRTGNQQPSDLSDQRAENILLENKIAGLERRIQELEGRTSSGCSEVSRGRNDGDLELPLC
ncbi:unnamed protein product [Caenorhabditis nigoni]